MITEVPGPATGRAIADCLYLGDLWRHRKVESLRLMEGERGRRRVSLDCTPPPEVALAYEKSERDARSIGEVQGQVMVPLAMISKGALRHFDVQNQDGTPLPVLSRSENALVALSALLEELPQVPADQQPTLCEVLHKIVQGPPEEAVPLAEDLTLRGEFEGQSLIDTEQLSAVAEGLVRDLAGSFLLIALVPAEHAGQRVILKYSFHWRTIMNDPLGWIERVAVAAGYRSAPVELQVHGASDASSYHLEVHAPPGLLCCGLHLPPPTVGPGRDEPDLSNDVVAHAVGTYSVDAPPAGDARLLLAVPKAGLRTVATLTTLFTAIVFLLEEFLPGARGALQEAGDGAVAILLTAPAVALALLARPGENALASYLLAPLRVAVLACAALLSAGAASLVGWLHEPFISILWRGGAVATGIAALALLTGLVVGAVSDTDSDERDEEGGAREENQDQ